MQPYVIAMKATAEAMMEASKEMSKEEAAALYGGWANSG